jgi:hypothetical protein
MAIGAHELRDTDILIGDWISPNRYGSGASVQTVNHEEDSVYTIVAGNRPVEFIPRETVYVRR